MTARYENKIPWWMRAMGCYQISKRDGYEFRWGQITLQPGLTLQYSIYHERAHICVTLIWPSFYIRVPMLIEQRDDTEDWMASYGFTWHERAIQFKWRTKFWIARMPWDWEHVRHDYLRPDGSLFRRAPERWEPVDLSEVSEKHPYTYTLRNGTVQHRAATINGEEREWRWRWFRWLPWPRMVQRSINIEFSDEVGERTGSWKGGTVGCGYEWRHGETMLDALRRMEAERKFK